MPFGYPQKLLYLVPIYVQIVYSQWLRRSTPVCKPLYLKLNCNLSLYNVHAYIAEINLSITIEAKYKAAKYKDDSQEGSGTGEKGETENRWGSVDLDSEDSNTQLVCAIIPEQIHPLPNPYDDDKSSHDVPKAGTETTVCENMVLASYHDKFYTPVTPCNLTFCSTKQHLFKRKMTAVRLHPEVDTY